MFRVFKIFWTRSRVAAILLSASVAIFGMSPAHATTVNFVKNGNFTATTLASPGGYICQVGKTCTSNVTNWASACNNNSCGVGATNASLLFAGTNGSAFNGNRGLYGTVADAPGGGNTIAIDGNSRYGAAIWQTLTGLEVNKTYILTFSQAAAQQKGKNGATTERWQVSLGKDSQLSTLMNNASHGVTPWFTETMSFTATSTSEVLKFLAIGTPAGDPPIVLLSGVALTGAVPEPETWALMLVGLGMTGVAMRRRMTGSKLTAA